MHKMYQLRLKLKGLVDRTPSSLAVWCERVAEYSASAHEHNHDS